jgi:predicted dehydrogenase
MSPIRIAIVGAGLLGTRHARVFHEQPESRLVAVVDVNQERAQTLATRYGATAYTDLQAVLAEDQVDAVAVVTPDFLHRDPVVAALQAGKHVFVEKPLATTLAEVRELVQLSTTANVVTMVNYSQRFLTDYAWIKQAIDRGAIGQPMMVTSLKFDTIYVPTGMLSWAAHSSPFYFMSSHDLDLTHWFLGVDPVSLYAQETRGVLDAKGVPVHDGVNVLISFGGNISTNFHASWIHPDTYPAIADGYMQIIGAEGVITYQNRTRKIEFYNKRGGQEIQFTGPATATEVNGKLVGAFTDSVRHFLDCIQQQREPLTSPRRILPTAEAQTAVQLSLQRKQPVSLPMES